MRLPRRGNTRQQLPRKNNGRHTPKQAFGKTEKPNTSFWEQRKSQTLRFGKRELRTLPYSTIAAPHVQTRHPDRRSARTAYNLGQKDAGAIRNDADDSVGLTCCKRWNFETVKNSKCESLKILTVWNFEKLESLTFWTFQCFKVWNSVFWNFKRLKTQNLKLENWKFEKNKFKVWNSDFWNVEPWGEMRRRRRPGPRRFCLSIDET